MSAETGLLRLASTQLPVLQTNGTHKLGWRSAKGVSTWWSPMQLRRAPSEELLKQVSVLLNRPADPDSGFMPPSVEASLQTIALLTALEDAPPIAGMSDDGEGGLEVYWMGPKRHVQLNVPANARVTPTVFWDDGDTYAVGPLVWGQLSERLRWFREA